MVKLFSPLCQSFLAASSNLFSRVLSSGLDIHSLQIHGLLRTGERRFLIFKIEGLSASAARGYCVLGRASFQLNGPSQQAQLLEGYRRHGPHVVARAHPSDLAHLKARNDSYTGNSLALVSYA